MSGYDELLRGLGDAKPAAATAAVEAQVPAAQLDRLLTVEPGQPVDQVDLGFRSVVLLATEPGDPDAVALTPLHEATAWRPTTDRPSGLGPHSLQPDLRSSPVSARVLLDVPAVLRAAGRSEELLAVWRAAARVCAAVDPSDWPPRLVEAMVGRAAAQPLPDLGRELYHYAIARQRRRWGTLVDLLGRWPTEIVSWSGDAAAGVMPSPIWLTEHRVLIDPMCVLVTPPGVLDRLVVTLALAVWHDAPARLRALDGTALIGDRPCEPRVVALATAAQAWLWGEALARGASRVAASPTAMIGRIWAAATTVVPVEQLDPEDQAMVAVDPDLITVTGDPPTALIEYTALTLGVPAPLIEGLTWQASWTDTYRTVYDRLPPAPPTSDGDDGRDGASNRDAPDAGGDSRGSADGAGDDADDETGADGDADGDADGGGDGDGGGRAKQRRRDGAGRGGAGDSDANGDDRDDSDDGDERRGRASSGQHRYREVMPDRAAQRLFGLDAPKGDPAPTGQERRAAAAAMANKLPGTEIGATLRELATEPEPPRSDLVTALMTWAEQRVAQAAADEVAWRHASQPILRRYGVWWPARAQPALGAVAVVLDVSASMTSQEIATASTALQEICRYLAPECVRVYAADMAVGLVAVLDRHEIAEMTATLSTWCQVANVATTRGGGGTNMGAAIRYAAAPPDGPDGPTPPPALIVVLTDCYTPWGDDPRVPVVVGRIGRGGSPPPAWAVMVDI